MYLNILFLVPFTSKHGTFILLIMLNILGTYLGTVKHGQPDQKLTTLILINFLKPQQPSNLLSILVLLEELI